MILLFNEINRARKYLRTGLRVWFFWEHVKSERSIIYQRRDNKTAMGYASLEFKKNIRTEDRRIIHVIC